jgi:release factor glutamine methyltransferase
MDWEGLWIERHADVYQPHHDSFLLARSVAAAVRPGDRWVDVGCGAGIVAMIAARAGAQVTATDMNPHAVRLTAANAHTNGLALEAVCTDLVAGVQQAAARDGLSFNPPYLPTAPDEVLAGPLNAAFDGGPTGNDVVLRLAEQLRRWSVRPRQILVVHSSLSDPAPLADALAALGYASEIAARESHFFEELTVRRFFPAAT